MGTNVVNASSDSGRERLIETARRLFTRRGASNVGINEVTAEAGVARMTLYNNFPSKEALTAAVYEQMVCEDLDALKSLPSEGRTEEQRILALFDIFHRRSGEPGFRGCPYIHASLQAPEENGPVYAIVHAYKRSLRAEVMRLLDTRRRNRGELADQLVLLLDGAVTEAYLKGVAHPAKAAKKAAAILLRARR